MIASKNLHRAKRSHHKDPQKELSTDSASVLKRFQCFCDCGLVALNENIAGLEEVGQIGQRLDVINGKVGFCRQTFQLF